MGKEVGIVGICGGYWVREGGKGGGYFLSFLILRFCFICLV